MTKYRFQFFVLNIFSGNPSQQSYMVETKKKPHQQHFFDKHLNLWHIANHLTMWQYFFKKYKRLHKKYWTFKYKIFQFTQSLSQMITVSAATRFTPRPPALVLSKKTCMFGSELNFSICKQKRPELSNFTLDSVCIMFC